MSANDDWLNDPDYDEEGNLDVEWYPIPDWLAESGLSKAQKPPGRGWQAIPGGKKGGYRKRKTSGRGYDYWYPDADSGTPLATLAQRTKAQEASMERDPTRTFEDLKAGEIIEVGGRSGRYKLVPGAKRASALNVAVQSMTTGGVEIVRRNTLIPLKKRRKARKKAPPPPPPRQRARSAGEGSQPTPQSRAMNPKVAIPESWPKGPVARGPETDQPSGEARKAKVWGPSTAPEGSALEAVENGSLMLRQFQGRHDRRMRYTIEVPDQLKAKLAEEMTGVFHQSARKVAKSFRPPIPVMIPGSNQLHPDYEELVAGAQLGFVMALTNYQGGRAFIPVVQDYSTIYALQAARNIRRGVALKERDLRALKGFIAARMRAMNVKSAKSGADPTRDEIVKQWYLTKRMVFTGRMNKLGSYATKDEEGNDRIVDQAHEQVPDEPWQVVTPAGKPEGKFYPGKKQLAEKMEMLLNGEDVPDEDWLQQAPSSILPNHDDLAMTAGTALHVRREVMDILATMRQPESDALAMRFGMYTPEDEDPDALHGKKQAELKAMARDRGLPVGGNKNELVTRILQWSAGEVRPGTKGYEASATEVADALGLGQDLSAASRGAKIRRIWKDGIKQFQAKAFFNNASVAEYVKLWSKDLADDPAPSGDRFGPMLPSHSWLKDRFGNDERVYIYQAAMRAGTASEVARKLERERDGKLSAKASAKLRADYHAQLHADAQEAFNRYRAVTVDPDKVYDIGPNTGTPGEAEWLYTENVLTDYMRARIAGNKE
jgi:hypothetical protein